MLKYYEYQLNIVKSNIEHEFMQNYLNTIKQYEGGRDLLRQTFIEMEVENFKYHMEEMYHKLSNPPAHIENLLVGISKSNWDLIIDRITTKVIAECGPEKAKISLEFTLNDSLTRKKRSWFSKMFRRDF